MCRPDRHVAQGVPGPDHGPWAARTRHGLGRLLAGGVPGWRAGRASPRRRADGRCHQGLGSSPGLEGWVMSATAAAEGVEAGTIPTSSLCIDLAQRAQLAARRLAVARGSTKDAWLA